MNKIDKALKIATRDLRNCYGKHGIFAGLHHFKDYWARDSLFASFGSLELKDYDIVRKNLGIFLLNVNKRGQLPLRYGRTVSKIILRKFGIKTKRMPLYKFDFSNKITVDQNSLFIIVLYEYYKKTKDKSLFDKMHLIEKIMNWNFNYDIDNDLLIEEPEFANWADSIKKKGKVLYTNVCHCHALFCLSQILKIKKNNDKHKKYLELYKKVKKKINELFWNGEHYIDWIDKDKQYNYFSSDGNFLAILWDIASLEKAKHIEEYSHIWDIHETPSQNVHPKISNNLINPLLKGVGLGDYHNGLSWLWLGAINALAKDKVGMKKEAKNILNKMSDLITEYKYVYEIYDKKGPVNRLLYKSEYPFAWSSGMFIYACKKII